MAFTRGQGEASIDYGSHEYETGGERCNDDHYHPEVLNLKQLPCYLCIHCKNWVRPDEMEDMCWSNK